MTRPTYLVFVLVLFLLSVTGAQSPSRAQVPDVLVIAQGADIVTGDPLKTATIPTYAVLANVYDTLVARNTDMRSIPGLATSWQLVEPTVWEFRLRRGVRFHNGEPFNAAAVKFSIERMLDPKTRFPAAATFRPIKSVTVVDDYTVRVTTDTPWPPLPAALARYGWIVPPRYLQQNGDEALVRRPVGTGPYRFIQWIKDDRVELEADPNHWRGRPRIGRVIVRAIPSDSSRLAELLSGSVHLINLVPPEIYGPIERASRTKLVHGRSASMLTIELNLLNPQRDRMLTDKRVRQALNLAVDRKTLNETIMRGASTPVATFCLDVDFGCDLTVAPYPYDPDRARTLLREAGYADGFEMTILGTSGVYPGDHDLTLAVADQLNRVGVRAQPVTQEYGVFIQQLFAKRIPQNAFLIRHTSQLGFARESALIAFRTGGLTAYWSNQEFDQAVDAAGTTTDEGRLKDLMRRAEMIFREEAPAIPLFTAPNSYGMHRDLEWVPRPDLLLTIFDASWRKR